MKRWVCAGLVLAAALSEAPGQTNGIFADFTTSMGNFTVWLDYERAPRAVASFVGLATGEGGWLDPQGVDWRGRKFYDGSLIHRVVTNATGKPLAIQGGGIPYCGIAFTNRQHGPADTGFSFSPIMVTTNPPGVTTNDFLHGLVPFTTVNPPAVATNYSYGGVVVQTNALAITYTRIQLVAWSSNAAKYVVNSHSEESWFTNATLQEVVTTNWATIFTVTTNTGAANEVLLHQVQLSMASTTTIRAPVASTNFAGAGYSMLDSATNGLVHTNGVISMANSGPNTDGSQFFIMVTNWPSWDGSYTVFGHVTTGMTVVSSIAAVALQENERPREDVVLSNVVIRRDSSAADFNVASQRIPEVGSAFIAGIKASSNQASVDVTVPAFSKIRFRTSTDGLQSWQTDDWGYQTNATAQVRKVDVPSERTAFFHASCVRYADAWTAPTSQWGRALTFWWDTQPVTQYRVFFTVAPGVWERSQGTNVLSGTVFVQPYAPRWTSFPYSAQLYFADQKAQYFYSLWFDPGKATNRFTCTMSEWLGGTYWLTGTFTTN